MKQINGLNTLRAFAVFFVIMAHFGVWFNEYTPYGRIVKFGLFPDGGFGVDLFFVLSGFLITSILLNAKDADPDESRFIILKNFFIRRALRIFPIYYILLFLLTLIDYPDIRHFFWYYATYTSNILSYSTNTWNNYSHTWSLSVEEQFYLLWPWLIIFISNRYLKYVLFGAVFTGILSTYIGTVIQGHMAPLMVYHTFDAFGLGGMYAWARLNSKRCRNFEITVKIVVIPALCMFYYWKYMYIYGHPSVGAFLTKTVNSAISMWLIILVVNNRSVLIGKYFLDNKFLNYIGKISYGIYLYHYPYILYFRLRVDSCLNDISAGHYRVHQFVTDHAINYWIHVSVIVIIAAISFRFIEKPLLNLKNYFNYNNRKTSQATSASRTQ